MANMRLRLNPEIHITDGISVHAQFAERLRQPHPGLDPQAAAPAPASARPGRPSRPSRRRRSRPRRKTPSPRVNVARAWAEVTNTALGQIRFGRMPSQWGLGLVANAGNGVDSDFRAAPTRLMYAARIRSLRMFIAGFYDFALHRRDDAEPPLRRARASPAST